MNILKAKDKFCVKFILEALQQIKYETGGYSRHWISVFFSKIYVLVPRIAEQQIVADFLYSMDSKIDVKNQILQQLENQKKYFLADLPT